MNVNFAYKNKFYFQLFFRKRNYKVKYKENFRFMKIVNVKFFHSALSQLVLGSADSVRQNRVVAK